MWQIAKGQSLDLSKDFSLMGIVNYTPDSFSDGGCYFSADKALILIKKLLEEGAAIIDLGAESTRPQAQAISAQEEERRLLPILEQALASCHAIFSIDTYRASTAQKALQAGAHIINDVFGLQKDPLMAEIIASYGAGVVIMHTDRERIVYDDVIVDQQYFFEKSLTIAHKAGIKEENIVLDPGFGFGKNAARSIALFKRVGELDSLGYPLLGATSRKGFLGFLGEEACASERDILTAASSILLAQKGFKIFRVHNIKANRQALRLAMGLT